MKHQKVSKYYDHDCGCVCVKRPTLNQNGLKMSTLRSQCPKRLFCSTCCFQFSSRFEKGCQMLQSPRRKKTSQTNPLTFAHFSIFLLL